MNWQDNWIPAFAGMTWFGAFRRRTREIDRAKETDRLDIPDTVGELSTTCCQLVEVASILNQYWTSWQHVVLKPVQT